MKIRNDFVSNSSSSSFIVIRSTNLEFKDYSDLGEIAVPTLEYGNAAFGWAFEKYDDFWSKLNFCAVILSDIEWYAKRPIDDKCHSDWLRNRIIEAKNIYEQYKTRLVNVCKDKFNLDIEIMSYSDIENSYSIASAYIDHQSSWPEDPSNARMFEDEYTLADFLASSDSYIKTGNDNSDDPPGWRDCTD